MQGLQLWVGGAISGDWAKFRQIGGQDPRVETCVHVLDRVLMQRSKLGEQE